MPTLPGIVTTVQPQICLHGRINNNSQIVANAYDAATTNQTHALLLNPS